MTNHLTMRKSWGLYHAVVAESGAFGDWVTQNMATAEWTYQNLLQGTNCADLQCLLGKTTDEIFSVATKLPTLDPYLYSSPFVPTADGVEITTHPWIALANGAVADVPIILGTNADEGAIFTYVPHTIGQSALDEHWHRVNGYSAQEIAQLTALYVTGKSYPAGHASTYWYAAQRSTGDHIFSCPSRYGAQQLGKLHALPATDPLHRASSTYMYHFEHHPRNADYTRHVSELEYVFHQQELLRHDQDAQMADVLSSYWGNFFASSDPNIPTISDITNTTLFAWPAYVAAQDNLLAVVEADEVSVVQGLKQEECDFLIPRMDAILRAAFPPV